jgi:hypothetical protein
MGAIKNSVALVRKKTIQTERPPLVGEDSVNFCRYFSFHVLPQLYSQGWVDPVTASLLGISGSDGNRTRDLWSWSQELWPLDHRGGLYGCHKLPKIKKISEDLEEIAILWCILASCYTIWSLDILVGTQTKLRPGLSWQKQHSTRRLSSSEN